MLIVYQPDLSLYNSLPELMQKAKVLAIQKNVVVQFSFWGDVYYVNSNKPGTQMHGEGFKGLNIFPEPTARVMN